MTAGPELRGTLNHIDTTSHHRVASLVLPRMANEGLGLTVSNEATIYSY